MADSTKDNNPIKDFPGKLEDGEYKFPVIESLYNKSTKDNKPRSITKQIIVVLFDSNNLKIPIDEKYFANKQFDELTNCYCNILTRIKMVKSNKVNSENKVYVGKNLGKKNQTNCVTQAIKEAYAKYKLVVLKMGSTLSISADKITYKLMLLSPYNGLTPIATQNMFIQPKLDGIRVAIRCYFDDGMKYYLFTRGCKIIPESNKEYIQFRDDIVTCLQLLTNNGTIEKEFVLDGEVYSHGKKLQEINSNNKETINVKINLFDIFYPNNLDIPFSKRLEILRLLPELKTITVIETKTIELNVDTENTIQEIFKDYILKGYEGAVLRYDLNYILSPNDYRSNNTFKLKKTYSDEFKCINIIHGIKGRGLEKALMTFESRPLEELEIYSLNKNNKIFLDKASKINFTGLTFDCSGSISEKESKMILDNTQEYIGKMYTVEYDDISMDCIPLRGRFLLNNKS